MLLNFNGLLKSASLFLLTLMLSGCISFALVSNAGKRTSGTYKYQSDTITGLSLAKDSNGTKGYVFVGESLDYLITDGGDDVVVMLNDPAINRHNIQVANDAIFVIESGKKKFTGKISLYYNWATEEDKALAIHYGFACGVQNCTWTLENMKGSIHEKNKKMDYSKVMAFYHPFKVGFYKRYSSGGIPDGAVNTLLPVTLTLDVITSPLQLIVASAMSK
ncbi:hypothetical protein N6N71_16280 [Escherichia albertii]|uniref:YidX family protein n=1 Tax=Escherichia albertii TaxID=208962 RepID=UPI0021D43401|nr:hypothetical protein [Escherichia albertii]MCU7310150.1 hypothetical protein [Escherichia albertii]MCZ8811449.1 hypothetical protein [Escherichia albertii]